MYPKQNTIHSHDTRLIKQLTSHYRSSKIINSCQYMAIKIFNNLPNNIKNASSKVVFKTRLRKVSTNENSSTGPKERTPAT